MKVEYYQCDRCRVRIDQNAQVVDYGGYSPGSWHQQQSAHLCAECYKQFKRFLGGLAVAARDQ